MTPSTPSGANRAGRLALLIGVVLIVLGAKWLQIEQFGSDLPYWDQWDADGDVLLRPHVEGTLKATDLLLPHNEHRPVLTRLLSLGLFEAGDGQWDARVQMVTNTLLHAGVALLLALLAWRILTPLGAVAFGALTVLLFTSESSWENTLAGFQSQFYFVLLFSALHIAGSLLARPRSWAWWLTPLFGVLALVSMASGTLAPMAVLAAVVLRVIRDRTLARDDAWLLVVNGLLAVLGLWMKAEVPGHEVLKSHSLAVAFDSLLHQLAWPIPSAWGAGLGLLPPVAIAVAYFRRRIQGPIALLLVGACAWALLQVAAISYARGAEAHGYSSRYFDTNSVVVLVNFLALSYLSLVACPERWRSRAYAGLLVILVAVVWGLSWWKADAHRSILSSLRAVNEARIENVRDYLANRNPAFLSREPWSELPYPSAGRLATLLEIPAIRTALPASVRVPANLEIDEARTRGFSRGLPQGLQMAPRSLVALSSSPGDAARLTSLPLDVDHRHATLFVRGTHLSKARVWLTDQSGREYAPLGELGSGDRWKRVNFSVPKGRYRLHASHSGDGFIALTQPITRSGLSIAAERIAGSGMWLVTFGFIAGMITLACLLPPWIRQARTQSPPTRQVLAAASAAAIVAVLTLALAVRSGALTLSSDPPPPEESEVLSFGLNVSGHDADPKFKGAVFLVGGDASAWWGTFVDGDGFTGRVESAPFRITGSTLRIPVIGYPNSAGNSLAVEIAETPGQPSRSIRFTGANPRERPGLWNVPVHGLEGREARLVLNDGETRMAGWLGVRAPLVSSPSGVLWLEGIRRNYPVYVLTALTLAVLLFLPGLAWRTVRRDALGSTALLPLPGLALLVAGGLVVWLAGGPVMERFAPVWLAAYLLLAVWLAWQWWCGRTPMTRSEAGELGVYASVVTAALAMGVLPLEVAQEFDPRSTTQARMIATPPDHATAYRTAVFFWHGKSGREDREAYFGREWSLGSRGPLLPFATAAGFTQFKLRPSDPPGDSLDAWPASPDGFHAARALAILLNALVVLGGVALARRLAPQSAALALVWLAVSPLVAINTDFIWPKLLAAFFVLLAIESVFARRSQWIAAGFAALAYYAHPVGGLFAVPLATLIAHRTWLEATHDTKRRAIASASAALMFGLRVLLFAAPWFAYKAWLGWPDFMAKYPFGDGHGFSAATSIGSWLHCRWSNLWLTLVPGGFQFSSHMTAWLGGPVSEPLRWAIGYAKTLPGGVGLAAFGAAAFALGRRPSDRNFALLRTHYIFGALALILLYWGYSADGLGRNCLEPLAALVIVYSAAALAESRWLPWLVLIAAFETLSVRAIGVVFATEFQTSHKNAEIVALVLVIVVCTVAPAIWLAWPTPLRRTDRNPC